MFIFDASSVTVMPGLSRTTLRACSARVTTLASRSEEHTSELQSRLHLVCRLLLEKKKEARCLPRQIARHRRERAPGPGAMLVPSLPRYPGCPLSNPGIYLCPPGILSRSVRYPPLP